MQLDTGPWQRIGWKAPEAHIAEAQLLAGLTSRASGSLGQLVKTLGVPHVTGATPLEEARVLLRAASEVEHALLVEYLYVAWSVATAQRAIQIRPSNERSETLMCQMLAHVPCPCIRARARYLRNNSNWKTQSGPQDRRERLPASQR